MIYIQLYTTLVRLNEQPTSENITLLLTSLLLDLYTQQVLHSEDGKQNRYGTIKAQCFS